MNAQSITAFTDAAADAVGRAIAGMQREARQEKELRDADYRVRVAELDTQRATVAELERRLADRMAAVKDGERGLDGKDADPIDLTFLEAKINHGLEVVRSQIEPHDTAPDDVASNVALAVRMMAETPNAPEPKQHHVINVHSNVTVPEAKPSNVNLTIPEQASPIVNVAPPNVVIEAKRSKEVTTVTGYDKNGRITSFEKRDVDAD